MAMEGNFKARCIKSNLNDGLYTVNKIYEISNGNLTWDYGSTTSENGYGPFDNVKDLNNRLSATFELVEKPRESETDTEKFLIKHFLQKATDKELLIEFERRLKKWAHYMN